MQIITDTEIVLRPDLRPRTSTYIQGPPPPEPMTAAERREREAPYAGENITLSGGFGAQLKYVDRQRLLTTSELMQVYRRVPDVRICVDKIARVVSTYDYSVRPRPEIPADSAAYQQALRHAKDAETFLAAPNTDGETFQDWLSQLVRDLGIFDAGASENCFSSRGVLEELVPVRGGDVLPLVDRKRRLLQYRVEGPYGEVEFLDPDQLLYMNLFPNTSAPGGTPLIETLALEWAILLNANRHLLRTLDGDQWGPGLLMVSGIAGAALKRFKEDMENKAGRSEIFRILGADKLGGEIDGKLIKFDQLPTEVQVGQLVHETRRSVWRLYDVKPVSVGDSEATPRATAEVQVDAESSGLIQPILELVAGKLNSRTIPLIVGADGAALVEFGWDVTDEYGPDEEAKIAEAAAIYLDKGVLSINEVREEVHGKAAIAGGEEPTVDVGGNLVRVSQLDAVDEQDEAASDQSDQSDQSDETADSEEPVPEDAPGNVAEASVGGLLRPRARRVTGRTRGQARRRGRAHATCSHGRSSLPSDWQPEGKFQGKRTLDLGDLADAISGYRSDVEPLWRRAKLDTLSAVADALAADGGIDVDENRQKALERAGAALEELATKWAVVTAPRYREAARLGRAAASRYTGALVVEDWQSRGDRYAEQAMGYLGERTGLLHAVQLRVAAVLSTTTDEALEGRVRTGRAAHAAFGVRAEDEEAAIVLAAVAAAFDANEHRIDNYSGKLVDLASRTLHAGMVESTTAVDDPDEDQAVDLADRWVVEWVGTDDRATCPECRDFQSRGFMELGQLTTHPGGNTSCRGRDRCVLVYWRASEVTSGEAESLND